MSGSRLRGVIIGCGGRGAHTFETFVEAGGEPVGVCDPSEALPHLKDPSIAPHFRDLETALDKTKPDVAMICSPNFVHAEQFMACAKRGIHVWVDKPIALSVEDAIAMRDIAREQGTITLIPFAVEQDVFKRRAIDLFRAGKLGPLVQFTMTRTCGAGFDAAGGYHYAIQKPEISGGWLIHHLCHMVDFAMQIGGPIEKVHCHCATTVRRPKPNQEEAITAMLYFRGGGFATLTDIQCGHKMVNVAVCGEQGTYLHTHYHDRRTRTAEDVLHEIETTIREKSERTSYNVAQTFALVGGDRELMERFFKAVQDGGPSPVPIERGVENIMVCDALQRSAQTGLPVELQGDWLVPAHDASAM